MSSFEKPIPPLLYNTSANPHFVSCIDPGKRLCGLAIGRVALDDSSRFAASLLWAGTVNSPSGNPGDMAYHATQEHLYRIPGETAGIPTVFVLEVPQKYSTQRATHGGVSDLEAVLDEIRERVGKQIRATFKPRVWKGNLPKKIHHARLRSALTPDERELTNGLDHNAMDAIGIFLFATGRTRRGGVVYK